MKALLEMVVRSNFGLIFLIAISVLRHQWELTNFMDAFLFYNIMYFLLREMKMEDEKIEAEKQRVIRLFWLI